VEATKTLEIYKAPSVMIVQLNRFKAHNSYFREKVEDHVDCPTDGLDLKDYLVKPVEGENYIYDLTGITKHMGGLGGGHYTAHAKNSETG
jgi:ubiquitin carboxyl-terminal hydrolase 4/11/15